MNPSAHLTRRDKTLAKIIKLIELKPHKPERNYFYSLAESIISQQLSVKAADTITKRLIALFPGKPGSETSAALASGKSKKRKAEVLLPGRKFPTPQEVLDMPPKKIRSTGVSNAKVKYLKDLARHVADKRLDFHKFHKWTDEEIIQHLISVHGIGRWTAEMFLMFSLNRPDVFSPGDQGLKNAIRHLYGLRKEPTPKQLKKISDVWKPHRTLACRYLWRSLS